LITHRHFMTASAAGLAFAATGRVASAQTYPSQPVRIIVGFAAGSSGDIGARLLGHWLSERLGQSFIVENRTGAGTNIATEAVVRAPADGHTLLYATSANAFNATLYEKLSLDLLPEVPTVGDFLPGYTADAWEGICAPRNTPAEIVDKLNREITAALADPRMKARLADLGATPLVNSPAGFVRLIADETEKWGKVIRGANIRVE